MAYLLLGFQTLSIPLLHSRLTDVRALSLLSSRCLAWAQVWPHLGHGRHLLWLHYCLGRMYSLAHHLRGGKDPPFPFRGFLSVYSREGRGRAEMTSFIA